MGLSDYLLQQQQAPQPGSAYGVNTAGGSGNGALGQVGAGLSSLPVVGGMIGSALDPGKAYRDAAGQFGNLANSAYAFGQQQMGTQMQGLGQALSQYNPAVGAMGNYYSYMGNQGNLGNAYSMYGQSLAGPTQSQGAYQGAQRALMGPTSSQQFQSGLAPQLTGATSRGDNAYYQAAGQGQSAQQQVNTAMGSSLYGPSQTQQFAQNNPLNGQGASERYFNQASGQMGQQGMLEQQAGGLAGAARGSSSPAQTAFQTSASAFTNNGFLTDQAVNKNRDLGNNLQADLAKADQRYAEPGQLAGMQGDIKSAYNSANDVQGFAQRQGGNFEKQGMGEQFAQNFLDQSNPYQEREQKKLTDAMNQQFAARGVFNSGGAIAGLGNALGEFQAQNYKNMADVSAQGQQMQMQRLGQGQGLAQAASGEKQALGSNLQGLGQGLSQEWLGRDSNRIQNSQALTNNALGLMGMNLQGANQGENARMQGMNSYLNAAGQAGQASLAGTNSAANILGQGQGAGLSRQTALGGLAQNAQSGELARMQYGLGANQAADASQLSRIGAAQNLAQGADAGRMGNLNALMQAAQNSDQNALASLQMQMGAAQGADSSLLARQGMLGNMAGQSDQQRLAGLQAMFGAAGGLDQYQNAQQLAYLQAQLGLSNNQAGLYGKFYDQGGNYAGQAYNGGLNAAGLGIKALLEGQTTNDKNNNDLISKALGFAGL